ncbi:hypothetical protein DEU56DRAFT_983470 [Suillus clintonianus]|uniref:uncharacterized protein n=1 Tax=Suillus clintonianus TaxID=1904413 RepID=UPI001B879706|nr:uncharacterized protein DEU56DRAFT_983470 [Suillus clintonianus]KAG2124816.1 hypothetical protein DEU56DRAFT_983470 [Suillus clintonianus]
MATKSDEVAPAPPLCDLIYLPVSADSVQCKHWNNALCCIRDIVSQPPGFGTPSSVTSAVNACAATLPAAEFSDLLQTRNIEGHTALYWAIVNNRPETFSFLAGFISQFSSDCSSDLRLACMTTSDNELFTRLNLGGNSNDPKDEPLRRSLGCPADEIQVAGSEPNQFVASFRIRMFQKRLRTTQDMRCEFIAGGRIWWLRFYMARIKKIWCAEIGLSGDSLPARPSSDAVLLIEAHKQKNSRLSNALQISLELADRYKPEPKHLSVAHVRALHKFEYSTAPEICNELGDWVMHDNSIYVDNEGTLHAKLKIKLSLFATPDK